MDWMRDGLDVEAAGKQAEVQSGRENHGTLSIMSDRKSKSLNYSQIERLVSS